MNAANKKIMKKLFWNKLICSDNGTNRKIRVIKKLKIK